MRYFKAIEHLGCLGIEKGKVYSDNHPALIHGNVKRVRAIYKDAFIEVTKKGDPINFVKWLNSQMIDNISNRSYTKYLRKYIDSLGNKSKHLIQEL